MKMSVQTLQQLRDLVPRHLIGRRNNDTFPQEVFNNTSAHLEKYCDTDYMTEQMIIPMVDGITRYKLDDRVRQTRGLYTIPLDGILNASRRVVVAGNRQSAFPNIHPDKSNPIRYDQEGNFIKISRSPAVDEPILVENQTKGAGVGSTLSTLIDTNTGSPLLVDQSLRGKGAIVTNFAFPSGAVTTVDHLIIASNNSTAGSMTFNGEMSQIPVNPNGNGTRYSIYNNFWILEYAIYLPRLSALTDVIGVPQDFEEVYRWSMVYQYYLQDGENTAEINRYERKFDQEIMRMCSDQNRFRSDNKITVPRPVPRPFPSSRIR